jgi:hypothetical protein
MKKTEESLRRLKKGQTSTFSLFRTANNAKDDESRDQERIRAQMIIDVDAFRKDAESIGVNTQSSRAFTSLVDLVHADTTEGALPSLVPLFVVLTADIVQMVPHKSSERVEWVSVTSPCCTVFTSRLSCSILNERRYSAIQDRSSR